MKNSILVYTAILVLNLILISEPLNCKGKLYETLNPYNDKEFIYYFDQSNRYIVIDLVEEQCIGEISSPFIGQEYKTFINGSTKKLAFVSNSSCHTYNYKKGGISIIPNLPEDFYEIEENEYSFSSDGSQIIVTNKNKLQCYFVDIANGNKTVELILNANPIFYSEVIALPLSSEAAFLRSDTLEVWSVNNNTLNRKIVLKKGAKNLRLMPVAGRLAYITGDNELNIIDLANGDSIFTYNIFNSENYDFTSNMDYLIYYDNDGRKQVIYSLIENKITAKIDYHEDVDFESRFLLFLSNDGKKSIGFGEIMIYCGDFSDFPTIETAYFIYNENDKKIINSLPYPGTVYYPEKVTFSQGGKLILLSSGEVSFLNALVKSENLDFVKYISYHGNPITITSDDKYLITQDSAHFYFYSLDSEKIEKTFSYKFNKQVMVHISEKGGKVFIIDTNNITILRYSDFSQLKKISHKGHGLSLWNISFADDGMIYYLNGQKPCSYNPITDVFLELPVTNLPACSQPVIQDYSLDGRYLLYRCAQDSTVFVYDIVNQNVKYSRKYDPQEKFKGGGRFLGSEIAVLYQYDNDYMSQTYGMGIFYMNNGTNRDLGVSSGQFHLNLFDYSIMFTDCPDYYGQFYTGIIKSVEDSQIADKNSLRLFPNPAGDYIEIDAGLSPGLYKPGEVNICNMLGEYVITGGIHELPVRFDVSALPPGVYTVQYGAYSKMFVKE